MTALSHPSSTNLSIPTTQNTAPVLSFSCLYTHDLRRKQKRWQDGVLKFHTFNKRIMVYDVPRNFVGDTHWREPQALQDGDELELEKGLLIQVGEEVERTETDLTELLGKRRPKPPARENQKDSQCGTPKYPTVGPSQAVSTPRNYSETQVETPFAQLRPKSLNALLGRPRGPVGKAAVPTKSPAQLRREKENDRDIVEKPLKRRRIEYPTSSSPGVTPATYGELNTVQKPVESAKTPAPVVKISRKPARRGSDMMVEEASNSRSHIDSVDTVIIPRRKSKESNRLDQRTNGIPSHVDQDSHTSATNCASPRAKKARRRQQQEVNDAVAPSGHGERPISREKREVTSKRLPRDLPPNRTLVEEEKPRDVFPEDEQRPEHMLRIASKRPRKKLMYRDLLPQRAPPNHDLQLLREHQRKESRSRANAPLKKLHTRLEDPLEDYHEAQQIRLQSRLAKRPTSTENTLEHPNEDEEQLPSTTDRPHSPFPFTFSSSLFLTPPFVEEFVPQSEPSPVPIDPPDSIPTSTQAARVLTRMDALLLQHPPNPTIQPQPPQIIKAALLPPQKPLRAFQRSASDLSARAPLNQNASNHLTKRSTTTLQKSLSDTLPLHPPPVTTRTATLYRSTSTSSVSTSPVQQEQVADPWSREAWDLFGFDGTTKHITSSSGIPGTKKGSKGAGAGEGGIEDIMMESQGFV